MKLRISDLEWIKKRAEGLINGIFFKYTEEYDVDELDRFLRDLHEFVVEYIEDILTDMIDYVYNEISKGELWSSADVVRLMSESDRVKAELREYLDKKSFSKAIDVINAVFDWISKAEIDLYVKEYYIRMLHVMDVVCSIVDSVVSNLEKYIFRR